MKDSLDVFYDKRLVGTIAKIGNKIGFQYSSSWLDNGFSISPLSLPLKKGLFIPKNDSFDGLFGVFSDSLPDTWGRLLLDRFLKRNKIEVNHYTRFQYLSKAGMGALEYKPSYLRNTDIQLEDLDRFQIESNNILDNESSDIEFLFKNGGSSGGSRPKAFIKIDGEDWIVKFQSRFDIKNVGKMEYEYAQCAKRIGINISETKLINGKYFAIKRFDRNKDKKIHMISAAGLLEADFNSPCLDYKDLFKLTTIVTLDDNKDIENLFLIMCFNVFAHNYDDHAKNFSFIYDESINRYKLSPAYDLTYSNTYYGEHVTSVNNKGKDINDNDLIEVGVNAGLKKDKCILLLNKVKQEVNDALSKYLK